MRIKTTKLSCWQPVRSLVLALAAIAPAAHAADGWTPEFDARYRFEHVDQDNALQSADAQALRLRVGLRSPEWHGLSGFAEIDHVSGIGPQHYNDTRNGSTRYSTVPDPKGGDLNQLWLQQTLGWAKLKAGRQRINLDNQRFVGGVAWRQNEQTYDAATLELVPVEGLTISYSYLDRIHTVFGPDDPTPESLTAPAEIDGHSQLFNVHYRLNDALAISAYHYRLGLDNISINAAAPPGSLSSKTTGMRLQGELAATAYVAEYARQTSLSGNPWDLDSHYGLIELAHVWAGVQWKLGHEVLGAGPAAITNGAFQTPLATKHLFQGWADVFLTTPADGLRDSYAGAAGPWLGGKWQILYHDFSTDRGSASLGHEWDVAYVRQIEALSGWTATVKYANYRSDDIASTVDTEKAWLQLQYSY